MDVQKNESHISPARIDEVYTWQEGELNFLSAEDFEEIKNSETFVEYRWSEESV